MKDVLWFPYAQMKTMNPPGEVLRAKGTHLYLKDGKELVDAIASWWCVIHGYNHPEITLAAKQQLDDMAHVMLGGLSHKPAIELAEKLVEITPEGLNHVFFGDSGSVGVEIALKMAIQYWSNLGSPNKTRFLALKQAYHGDTTGCMSVCDPDDGMHALFAGIVPQQLFLDSPSGGFDASPETVAEDLQALEQMLKKHHEELAGFIVEPLLQAAGGFRMYSPLYLQGARKLCDQYGVLLLFDEVATGFGRTGALFAANKAGTTPDIMVLGKGLMAGYLGHSATLATTQVFDSFYSDDPDKALMHGPTFMGNPLACAIALKGIEIFFRENYLEKIARIEEILKEQLLPLSSPEIKDVRVLGACGAIEVHDSKSHIGLQKFAADHGVWLRPFERYVYTMPPYIISEEDLLKITGVMRRWFLKS